MKHARNNTISFVELSPQAHEKKMKISSTSFPTWCSLWPGGHLFFFFFSSSDREWAWLPVRLLSSVSSGEPITKGAFKSVFVPRTDLVPHQRRQTHLGSSKSGILGSGHSFPTDSITTWIEVQDQCHKPHPNLFNQHGEEN